ncbi:M20/M25/M40 family metallo-hydrolase [Blastococcus sp. SYSU D00669]
MPRTSRTLAVVTAATAMITVTATSATAAPGTDTSPLTDPESASVVMEHLEELQKIADNNGGTRASGTPGYDASLTYISDLLEDAGYVVTRQDFTFNSFRQLSAPVFERLSPTTRTYAEGTDFFTAEYSGSGDVTAPVVPVDLVEPTATASTSTSGCEAADFTGFPDGGIALVQRGTCDFVVKAENAEAAGADGVIIYNEGTIGVADRNDTLNPTLGDQADVAIPVVGTSYLIGDELWDLTKTAEVQVRLRTETEIELDVPTSNLIAETPTGRDNQTVMAGAHLDSVPEGPGINDNGSGSAVLLEIALRMAELGIQPTNTVRFAFWGAEEAGLVGSQHYVDSLSRPQLNQIDLYLNFDMVGSPNYGRFIYDGDGSGFGITGPNGSESIEAVFESWFAAEGLATLPTAFDGRSDYDAFISAGIPAGGLFTGAEDIKTEEEAQLFGGVAGVAFDPCYHAACDSLDPVGDGADAALYQSINAAYGGALEWNGTTSNVNRTALEEMYDATAHAILTFAMATASVKNNAQGAANPAGRGDALGHHDRR